MSFNIKRIVFNKKIDCSLLYVICYILYVIPSYAADWSDPSGNIPARISDLEVIFSKILSLAVPASGIAAFIMLIAGGFKYLTSDGDPKKAQEAQQTITYALIGLILLVSAYIIISFIESFTGVDVSTFTISKP